MKDIFKADTYIDDKGVEKEVAPQPAPGPEPILESEKENG